jgi:hypothetical protein
MEWFVQIHISYEPLHPKRHSAYSTVLLQVLAIHNAIFPVIQDSDAMPFLQQSSLRRHSHEYNRIEIVYNTELRRKLFVALVCI